MRGIYEFTAKVQKDGRLQVAKRVLELIDRNGERDKKFIVTLKKGE